VKKKEVEKFCLGHDKYLPVDNFYYVPAIRGYGSYCKECEKAKKREWYKKNKEVIDAKRKKWQEDNYELHLKHQNKYNKSEKGKAAKQRHHAQLQEINKELTQK